jgi:hypothetical protein
MLPISFGFYCGATTFDTLLRRVGNRFVVIAGARPDKLREGQIEAIFAVLQRVGFY